MAMYKVTTKIQDIRHNTTILPDNAGGWLALNTGADFAVVNGYPLAPGQGLDFTKLPPDVIWNSEITIELSDSAMVRLTRLYYTKV